MTRPTESYHHGTLRETLLKIAFGLVDSQGVEAVSMRALAREAGVSSAAPSTVGSLHRQISEPIFRQENTENPERAACGSDHGER